jgi:hypothetical protein
MLSEFCQDKSQVYSLVKRSFLSKEAQKIYIQTYQQKLKALNCSFLESILGE